MKNDQSMGNGQMRPVIILPPGTMRKSDIKRLRVNGFCVVEAKDPAAVKFLDPIPAIAGRTTIEQAAISLSRKVLSREAYSVKTTEMLNRSDVVKMYVDILVRGTPLDPMPSEAEQEQAIFDQAKAEEIRKLTREEAKAERAAAKESRRQKMKEAKEKTP